LLDRAAISATAVAIGGVAVITRLIGLRDAVAAFFARLTSYRAVETRLDRLAVSAAAIGVVAIGIVALLATFHDGVAALLTACAFDAIPTRFFLALRATTIVVVRVAVVTTLARIHDAIAALDFNVAVANRTAAKTTIHIAVTTDVAEDRVAIAAAASRVVIR
jgi:hypothetical protein